MTATRNITDEKALALQGVSDSLKLAAGFGRFGVNEGWTSAVERLLSRLPVADLRDIECLVDQLRYAAREARNGAA